MAKSRKGSCSSARKKTGGGSHKRGYVPNWALRNLLKNGRDYSKPSQCGMKTKDHDKSPDWVQIIYTPMGGQNKKY